MFPSALTVDHLRRLVRYDQDTGTFTALADRGKIRRGDLIRGSLSHGYSMIFIEWTRYSAHRLAWFYMTGEWPSGPIDHRDGVKDNNRWSNLRAVTQGVNLQNQRTARRNNRTGLLGVGRADSETNPFRARIVLDGKERHLGCFKTADEASAAYLTAKRELHVGCSI